MLHDSNTGRDDHHPLTAASSSLDGLDQLFKEKIVASAGGGACATQECVRRTHKKAASEGAADEMGGETVAMPWREASQSSRTARCGAT